MDTNLNWKSFEPQIQKLSTLDYNYNAEKYLKAKDYDGWFVDRYESVLTTELPGVPLSESPFASVREALISYQFPDPKLISAVFDPTHPLEGRDMLMFAKFLGLTFTFGVRVTKVIDSIEVDPCGDEIKLWGYSYRTLAGHFEVGEIRFELRKNLRTGEVFFAIDAYSKPERIPNLFYRLGFRIFGRSLQKYFAVSSIDRLTNIARSA